MAEFVLRPLDARGRCLPLISLGSGHFGAEVSSWGTGVWDDPRFHLPLARLNCPDHTHDGPEREFSKSSCRKPRDVLLLLQGIVRAGVETFAMRRKTPRGLDSKIAERSQDKTRSHQNCANEPKTDSCKIDETNPSATMTGTETPSSPESELTKRTHLPEWQKSAPLFVQLRLRKLSSGLSIHHLVDFLLRVSGRRREQLI